MIKCLIVMDQLPFFLYGFIVVAGDVAAYGVKAHAIGKEALAVIEDQVYFHFIILQEFLDHWLQNHPGELDYIHGEETLRKLSRASDTVGFILPAIEKKTLFPCILSNGVLPRKTFSMGDALDKRYYLEARRIE